MSPGATHKLRSMMAQPQPVPVDIQDYFAAEDRSTLRHEYLGGYVYAMTGGSMRHNRIALNIASALMRQLAGSPCQVFINDMKLHVQAADSVYYPDVLVHCGNAVAGSARFVTSAALIVEVLSESTAETDRREKRAAYQRLAGLRAYWIVSQEAQHVQVHARDATGTWGLRECAAGDTLATAGLTSEPLALSDFYAGTDIA
jgi:Uma2 family endonuclease